jgi:hypothetical protein
LETKARFINQVMTGDNAARRAEDIGGQELSYAEVKAIASGNPAVLTLAEADAELQRLSVLRKAHTDEQYLARRSLRDLPGAIERLTQRLAGLTADQATLKAREDDAILIGSRAAGDPVAALGQALDALPPLVMQDRRVPLGTYRGLRFGMVLHPQWTPEVYLEGDLVRLDRLSREHHGPRAVLNAVERLARGYRAEGERTRQELDVAQRQLHDYQARVGQPFPHAAYLDQLSALRDQLKAGLSGAERKEGEPTVAELAERIKVLRAANTVEAPPQRTAKHRTSAEEPVTSRLRRRAEAIPVASTAEPGDEASQEGTANPPETAAGAATADPAPPGIPSDQPGTAPALPVMPEQTHQHRLAAGQRHREVQATLF